MRFAKRIWLLFLSLALAIPALGFAEGKGRQRLGRLGETARRTLTLRRTVRQLRSAGLLRTAHPEVARRLSQHVSQKLGRAVRIPARRIVQVEYGSQAHQQLKSALAQSVGVGIYPSSRYGHNKLRVGDLVADSVPRSARPFPSTGTRARTVPFASMHRRFYEAVFVGTPTVIAKAQQTARSLAGAKCQSGMGCANFVTKILREHIGASQREQPRAKPYNGKLAGLMRSESAAGAVWRKAIAAQPALIVVYTPPGDHRDVSHPQFKFDYALK